MGRLTLLVSVMAMVGGCSSIDWSNPGAPAGTGFVTKQLAFNGDSWNYTVFVPHDYAPNKHYPVILFLHGVLEGGSDGRKCVTVGIGPTIAKRTDDFDFITVFPQSGTDWTSEAHQRLAIATLDQVLKDYPAADADRVVLTGLSNGGDGTWLIGANYADRFAGLAPMCSGVDYDLAPKLARIPIWCFHNSVDPFRSSGRAEEMCKKVCESGGNAKFTEYKTFGHDCWTQAYTEGEVFAWMRSLRRATVVN